MLFKQTNTIFSFLKLRQTITNFRESISVFVPLVKDFSECFCNLLINKS